MDVSSVKIKAKRRILKYEEGADPTTDQPFEVVEKEDIFEGDQAVQVLKELGVLNNGSN